MRVWLINHFAIPPSESGGTRHYSLARALSTHGIAASVIASASNYQTGQARPIPEGATAHRETINGVEFLWLRAASHGKGASSRLLAMLDFAWKILRNVPGRSLAAPEVIVGSSPHLFAAAAACALAARLRVPFVLEVRDLWPASLVEIAGYPRFHPIILLMLLLERYVYRRAARIITLLPDAAPYFTARGARAENIVVIPNGVDVDLLDAPLPPAPANPHFTVLYAGAHGIPNQLETLIEAAEILARSPDAPTVDITLVGAGISKAGLQAMAAARGLSNVRFLPPVAKHAMPALLASADACYLQFKDSPLYQWGVSPNKLFDYLLAAKPVLYAANVRTNPVVAANAGIALTPGDAPALAEAIRALAAMPAGERAAMGARGRAYVLAHHHFATLGKTLAACLRSLV